MLEDICFMNALYKKIQLFRVGSFTRIDLTVHLIISAEQKWSSTPEGE